jgi:Xaa-Pro aminopeptidase
LTRRVQEGDAAASIKEAEERENAEKITHVVPEEFLGLGIRIEDDLLVTPDGNINMSASVPVEIDEIEALCAEAPKWAMEETP